MNKIAGFLLITFFFIGTILLTSAWLWYSEDSLEPETGYGSVVRDGLPPQTQPATGDEPLSFFDTLKDEKLAYLIDCDVNDSRGNPVAGAHLTIESTQGFFYRHSVFTNQEGHCRLMVLEPGAYRMVGEATGQPNLEENVTITSQSPRTLERLLTFPSASPSPTP